VLSSTSALQVQFDRARKKQVSEITLLAAPEAVVSEEQVLLLHLLLL